MMIKGKKEKHKKGIKTKQDKRKREKIGLSEGKKKVRKIKKKTKKV